MSLYGDWLNRAQAERPEMETQRFWKEYFAAETENYKKILQRKDEPFSGTLSELAAAFDMDDATFTGFLDGVNTSLADGEQDLEQLTADTPLTLTVDFDKLYFNMLGAKADWLYNLPEWEDVRTREQRHEILLQFRQSKVFVAEQTVGRNDPCPCGSGKKYKKCCGK